MERKYQVFVSSTYRDLITERTKVQQALLESDCIPIGMETLPPANDTQWEYIKKVIDQCDYYILIIAGRYGSINDATGISYAQQEYMHAVSKNIPILTLFHHDPGTLPHTLVESSPKLRKKLEEFRDMALKSRLARAYRTPEEVYAWVVHGVNQLKKAYPEGGWVPAKYLPPEDIQKELEMLRSQNHVLQRKLDESNAGKGAVQAIDTMQNHVACRKSMDLYIRESLRTSDHITIKVMAVSLHYSWDFLKNDLPIIMSNSLEHKKVSLELAMADPQHLESVGLKDWRDKGENVESGIRAFVQEHKAKGGLIASGRLELSLYQYRNIPHWHGTLINNHHLFLGRTRWIIDPDKQICRLTVGEELYRLFASNDACGGPDRIAMFNSWFEYYKCYGKTLFREYATE